MVASRSNHATRAEKLRYLYGQLASHSGRTEDEDAFAWRQLCAEGERKPGGDAGVGQGCGGFVIHTFGDRKGECSTVRCDPDWRRRFVHLAMRRDRRIAKVAMARKLAVRMYWMWRKEWDYQQFLTFGSHAGQLETGYGVK